MTEAEGWCTDVHATPITIHVRWEPPANQPTSGRWLHDRYGRYTLQNVIYIHMCVRSWLETYQPTSSVIRQGGVRRPMDDVRRSLTLDDRPRGCIRMQLGMFRASRTAFCGIRLGGVAFVDRNHEIP